MKKHTLKLLGGPRGELRVPAETLLETVGALLEGARQAVRFVVDGESTRKGPRPAWLDTVCKLEITGLQPGSAVVSVEAPTLAEAGQDRFGLGHQTLFFTEPQQVLNPDHTAIDLFGNVLAAAIEGDREHILADRALLDTCARFARAAGSAFEGIEIDKIAGRQKPLLVTPAEIQKIEVLRDETPTPKAIRVSGTLDTISATKSDIVLTLPSGEAIPAKLEEHNLAALRSLFGHRVVVSGMAQFRPSGRLSLIDVEYLAPATDQDALWEAVTTARIGRSVGTFVPQDETSGISAIFGTWPGEESDQELLMALDAIE